MANASTEPTVSMIHPQAWENERRIVEITQPIPASEWAEKVTQPGDELETLPYDSLIEEGPYTGGHVVMLHADDNTFLFAVPPEVILLMRGMLPDDQYDRLIERTPSLAGAAAMRRV
ncbi:MAG: hypothetical protein M3Q29_15775 [Chloroflexota bacterium]|nr:hypothetical protein [Chloroflexota bacterium]MDP9481058.1 hypothetical protein [Actinomycetota bacterium]